MARTQSRGSCALCGYESNKAGMTRHLVSCALEHDLGKGKPAHLLRLRVEDAYSPLYWLDLEMKADASLRAQAEGERYMTSVCTGALVLGTAGLLQGYRATTHWLSLDLLEAFGATPVRKRVVIDRDRVTGGGVTAGIDFGLRLAAELSDEATAKGIQLMMEYDPAPPFKSGSPGGADPELVARVTAKAKERQAAREEIVQRAANTLGEANC